MSQNLASGGGLKPASFAYWSGAAKASVDICELLPVRLEVALSKPPLVAATSQSRVEVNLLNDFQQP